jgi:hypothetical protein
MGDVNLNIRIADKGYSEAVTIKNQIVAFLANKPDWQLTNMSFHEELNL